MTTYKDINYTPEQIQAMRDWAKDCEWAEDQDSDFIDELTDIQVLKGVNQNYNGGLVQFLADNETVYKQPEHLNGYYPRLQQEGGRISFTEADKTFRLTDDGSLPERGS